MVATFVTIAVDQNLGLPWFLLSPLRWVAVAVIILPAVVLSGYVATVFGIAIYALAKVYVLPRMR